MAANLLKRISDFLARVPGLPIFIGALLVILNFVFRLLPDTWPVVDWLTHTDLFLHLGVIVGLIGVLLGDAL
ncbi:MAG: hypothetical protein JXA14_15145 [Anaerolineae bacterium]|nr:hypothetical protein [Anaerolineae bacterium]